MLVLEGGAVELLFGMEDLEGEDGEAVDDEAGGLGVEGRGGVVGGELEEGDVELFGEVVATLVEAIDVVLDFDDGAVGGVGVAGLIFAVPQIIVGLVLVEDELIEGRGGLRRGERGVVAVRSAGIVESDDMRGAEHGRQL